MEKRTKSRFGREQKIIAIPSLSFVFSLVLIISLAFSSLYSQQIDPFYLKLLKDGENSFLSRNYKEAIKELEIAAFGLQREKKLAGRAYIYLGLSQYYLKDKEKCEQYLKSAFGLLGENEIEGLNLEEAAKGDLEKLLNSFKLRINKEAEASKSKSTPSPKELEKRIKAEPDNVSLSYKLYELYRERNNLQAAKKVLQALVKKKPKEAQALYLLAKIDYSQKSYKTALEGFRSLLKLSDDRKISRELNLKSTLFVVLCLYHLDRRQSLDSFFDYLSEASTQEELRKMLKEEGLEEEWEKMRAETLKRSP